MKTYRVVVSLEIEEAESEDDAMSQAQDIVNDQRMVIESVSEMTPKATDFK